MNVDKKELEEKADLLEKKAKEEMENKNYLLALSMLSEAKEISTNLGFKGQVNSIEKKMVQIKNIMRFHEIEIEDTPREEMIELETEGNKLLADAEKDMEMRNLNSALKAYENAYTIFEKLNYDFQCQIIYGKIRIIKAQIDQEEPKQIETKNVDRENAKGKENIISPRERGVFTMELEHNEIKELKYAQQEKLRLEKEIQKLSEKKKDLDNRENELRKVIEEKNLYELLSEEDASVKHSIEKSNNIDETRREELEEAERRRAIIRKKMEKEKEAKRIEKERLERIQKQENIRKNKNQEEEERLYFSAQKEKEYNELKKKAEIALDKGRYHLDKREFKDAKRWYHKAIDHLKTLGWFDQVEIIYKEIKNIEKYETEHLKEEKEVVRFQESREKEFQRRIEEVKSEKERQKKERQATLSVLPPEIKNKLNKAELALEKAERESARGQIDRAIGRYQFALSLFKSISNEKYDFSKQISEIKLKISDLNNK